LDIVRGMQTRANYAIEGSIIPRLTFQLSTGETVIAQAGVLMSMDKTVTMNAVAGDFQKALKRSVLGAESFFLVHVTGPGRVSFTAGSIGTIMPVELKGNAIRTKNGAFLVSQNTVKLDITTERIGVAIVGGVGLFQLKLHGFGRAFVRSKGDIISGALRANESIVIDENHFLACDESVRRNRWKVPGIKNVFGAQEGLYMLEMTGPGRYWLETSRY
jgi:uncharacterized protein (AIM24 family)